MKRRTTAYTHAEGEKVKMYYRIEINSLCPKCGRPKLWACYAERKMWTKAMREQAASAPCFMCPKEKRGKANE